MEPNTYVPPPPAPRKTSPWVYVGCGCALLVLLAIGAGVLVFKKVAEEGHKFKEGMTNPRVREERTRALLSYNELPAGYYPVGALSIPFVFDMAMLGDRPPEATGKPDMGEHGFIFMKLKLGHIADTPEGRRRMLYGANGQAGWEQNSGLKIESHEELANGELNAGGAHLLYRASRGDVQINNRRRQGISSVMLVDCPDHRIRFGIWFVPDPAPGQPTASMEKAGTPADPQAITAFADHFKFCAGGD
jgi:hypothetical protein